MHDSSRLAKHVDPVRSVAYQFNNINNSDSLKCSVPLYFGVRSGTQVRIHFTKAHPWVVLYARTCYAVNVIMHSRFLPYSIHRNCRFLSSLSAPTTSHQANPGLLCSHSGQYLTQMACYYLHSASSRGIITGTYARSRPPAQPSAWWPRAFIQYKRRG